MNSYELSALTTVLIMILLSAGGEIFLIWTRDSRSPHRSYRSPSNATSTGTRSVHWPSSFEDSTNPLRFVQRDLKVSGPALTGKKSVRKRPSLPAVRRERYLYTYHLMAGSTPLQILISCVPSIHSICIKSFKCMIESNPSPGSQVPGNTSFVLLSEQMASSAV